MVVQGEVGNGTGGVEVESRIVMAIGNVNALYMRWHAKISKR